MIFFLLKDISYSASFIDKALKSALDKGITEAKWVIVQYDFDYNPNTVKRTISEDPIFIGSFNYLAG